MGERRQDMQPQPKETQETPQEPEVLMQQLMAYSIDVQTALREVARLEETSMKLKHEIADREHRVAKLRIEQE